MRKDLSFSMNFSKTYLNFLLFFFNFAGFNYSQDSVSFNSTDSKNQIYGVVHMGKGNIQDDIGKFSFGGGLYFSRLNKKKSLRSNFGVEVSALNHRSEKIFRSYDPLTDTFLIAHNSITFFNLPIRFDYFLVQRRNFSFYFHYGIYYSTFISYDRKIEVFDTHTENKMYEINKKMKPLAYNLFGLNCGIGFEYFFNNFLSLSFEPELNLRADFAYENSYSFYYPNIRIGGRYNF